MEGDAKSVVTQADIDAQAIIVGGLRKLWGDDLQIIGEEDEGATTLNYNDLNPDLLKDSNEIVDEEIPINELALFVDPLDGTREFVEGRLENVACLIGITRHSRPIAGVVGIPFPDGSTESDVIIRHAVADQESSAKWSSVSSGVSSDSTTITILTGDSKNEILSRAVSNAVECAKDLSDKCPNHLIVGGTAAKLHRVASAFNPSIAILHFVTELWDTAAPGALLECQGGKITDMFGAPLVHNADRPFGNIFGVVASNKGCCKLHDELCSRMRADVPSINSVFNKWMNETVSVPQAVDIARDPDGIPLSTSYIQEKLLKSHHGRALKGYSSPESGAVRDSICEGVNLLLNWGDMKDEDGDVPSSVFYKR